MASATASNVIHGQSLKSHFVPIWELALLIQSFDNFFNEKAVCYTSQQYLILNEASWMDLLINLLILKFFEEIKVYIHRANTQIGTKCDFRD